MSKATVQFVEMVRFFRNAPPPTDRRDYCQTCNEYTQHFITPHGKTETFTCSVCGQSKNYTVR